MKIKLPKGTYAHLQLHTNYLDNRGLHLVDPILHPQHEGEVMVLCVNRSERKLTIKAGRKIVWLVIAPYAIPSEIMFKDNFEQDVSQGLKASSV
jgi:dUTPase